MRVEVCLSVAFLYRVALLGSAGPKSVWLPDLGARRVESLLTPAGPRARRAEARARRLEAQEVGPRMASRCLTVAPRSPQ